MASYRFLQADVFTDKAFAGNPLAVFPEAAGLSDEVMAQIAREMNLSETVFVLESQDKKVLRRLRIYAHSRDSVRWSSDRRHVECARARRRRSASR